METNLTVFKYEGKDVSFLPQDNNTLVNATEMARVFGKFPKDFLKTQQTKDFINALAKRTKIPLTDLLTVRHGGEDNGTWMHEDLAIEFARWLSPDFSIWCNDRIKELMRHGITAMPSTIDDILANPDNFLRAVAAVKEERAKNAALLAERQAMQQQLIADEEKIEQKQQIIREKNKEINELKERTQYLDIIMSSKALLTTTQIAQDYGMSAKAFNRILAEHRIQYKQNNQWLLKYPYTAEGYVSSKTIILDNGTTILNTQWTQKGRLFLYKFLKRKGVLPTIEREDVEN